MGFDLNNDGDVNALLQDVYSSQNDEYRREIDKQWRILRGDLRHFVEDHLREIFPKTYQSFTPSEINLAARITNKRASAYKETPLRVLRNDKETEQYQEIMKDVGAKWVWRDFDTYKNHFKSAAMWFSFYEENGEQKIKLRALRPNQFSRIVNDRDQTEAFIVYLGAGDDYERISGDGDLSAIQDQPEDGQSRNVAIWTKDQHIVIKVEKTNESVRFRRTEPIEGNELGINELGMIPALFDQDGSEMELPGFNPLSNQTITLNFIMSVILTGMAAQSFGQLVVSHPEEQVMPDTMQQGLFTFMKLPQMGEGAPDTTADYISPSPNLAAMMETYRLYASSILDEHGVKGGEAIKGTAQEFASGLDRLLSQMDTAEIVESNQESYAEKEQELYLLIQEFMAIKGEVKFQTDELTVLYKKPRPMQSDNELLAIIREKLELGLIEEWEKFIIIDPNMSHEKAQAKQKLIDDAKELKMRAFLDGEANQVEDDTGFKSFGDKSGVQEGKEQDRA